MRLAWSQILVSGLARRSAHEGSTRGHHDMGAEAPPLQLGAHPGDHLFEARSLTFREQVSGEALGETDGCGQLSLGIEG